MRLFTCEIIVVSIEYMINFNHVANCEIIKSQLKIIKSQPKGLGGQVRFLYLKFFSKRES